MVPGEAAMVEDVIVRWEDAVRQPVVAHELPDVLDEVELVVFGRKRQQGDIVGDDETRREGQPARSSSSTACARGALAAVISVRSSVIPSVLQRGSTSAAPLPSAGQIAP